MTIDEEIRQTLDEINHLEQKLEKLLDQSFRQEAWLAKRIEPGRKFAVYFANKHKNETHKEFMDWLYK